MLKVFMATFIGAFVFGFIDNFILVIAGEAIDKTIAQTFGFSTMASAGIGNAISDVVGTLGEVAIAGLVIAIVGSTEGFKANKGMIMLASATGIFTGCMVGLIPLLFI